MGEPERGSTYFESLVVKQDWRNAFFSAKQSTLARVAVGHGDDDGDGGGDVADPTLSFVVAEQDGVGRRGGAQVSPSRARPPKLRNSGNRTTWEIIFSSA